MFKDRAFQLVRLEFPVEDKPACFFVAGLPESHEGVVAQSVERLTNHVETYLDFIRYLINPFEGLDTLVKRTLYPSRSAPIRFAVRDLQRRELWRLHRRVDDTEQLNL